MFLSFHSPSSPGLEEGYLVLYVTDAADHRVSNISLTCCGDYATAVSDSQGKVRLKLPPQVRPGDWVRLQIVSPGSTPYQVLISPWNNLIQVPRFEDEATNAVSVVVIRKGDREILRSGKAIEAIIARALKAERPKLEQEISAEERKRALQEQAAEVGLTPEEVAEAIREWGRKAKDPHQRGLALLFEGDYAESNKLLEESERQRRTKAQEALSDLADAIFFNGQSLYHLGKYGEAIEKFREVNTQRKDDADVLIWLGVSLRLAGRYAEAEPILKRALGIYEKALGKEHPLTATSLNSLAELYREQGKYAEAEPLHKRALEIREKALGKEHIDTATSLNNLAGLYYDQGKYAEAEPLFKRVVEIFEKALGKEHPIMATILENYAALLHMMRREDEANKLNARAQRIREKLKQKDDK